MTQTEFVKLVNGNQGTISKYIKAGKLPHQGKKLIMPDAEKAYHLIMSGISLGYTKQNNQQFTNSVTISEEGELEIPANKMIDIFYADSQVNFSNFENKSVAIYTDAGVSAVLNQYDNFNTTEIMLIDPDSNFEDDEDINSITMEIIPDGKHSEVISKKFDDDFDGKHYLVTQSELLEFLRSRIAITK